MSIIDKNLLFFEDEVITTGAPTEYKSDSIALSVADSMSRESAGEGLEIVIQVTKTMAGGTSIVFHMITAPEATLATDASQYASGAVLLADLVEGKKIYIPVRMPIADTASYFGVMAVATGTFSGSSAISAWIQRVGEDQVTINA